MEDLCIGMSCIVSVVLERLVLSAEISFPVDARALNVTSMHACSPSLLSSPSRCQPPCGRVDVCQWHLSREGQSVMCVYMCACARAISLEVYVFL